MKLALKKLMKKLTSRKFLLAAAGVVTGIANNNIELIIASVSAYILGESAVDITGLIKKK